MSSKFRRLVLFLAIGVLAVGLLSIYAYRRVTALWHSQLTGAEQSFSRSGPSNAAGFSSPASDQNQPIARISHVMAEPFDLGFLPSPVPAEEADPDEAVVSLVKKITARDENSTPALLSALQLAGLTVLAKDSSVYLRPISLDANQGMAFDAWELASMAKLYDEHWQLSLDDLSLSLSKALPALRKISFNDLFLKAMARSSQGQQPLRAWSRLIIELGRNSAQPYDLLAKDVDPKKVQLDSIQVSLILERIAGDALAADQAARPKLGNSFPQSRRDLISRLTPAGYPLALAMPLAQIEARPGTSKDPAAPCNLSETTLTIWDIIAIIKTTEWGELGTLGMGGEGVHGTSIASAVLLILKCILVYSSLNAEISMDSVSLVRTKDTDKGDTLLFTTRVWFDLGKWPILNCLRPLINASGIDFGNLPNNGAADGVGVSWFITEGGVNPWATTQNLQKFQAAQDAAIITFDNDGGAEGETYNNVTDKNGKATTNISGRPQTRDLTPFNLVSVEKEGGVAIEVKLKGADTEKFLGEMIDVIGPALGISSGDIIGGLAGGLTELWFRMHWQVGKDFNFPVEDWRICDKEWLGSITVVRSRHTNHSEPWAGFGSGLRTQSVDLTELHRYTIQSSDGSFEQARLHSDWTGKYYSKEVEMTSSNGNTQACSSATGQDSTTDTFTGSDIGHVDFALEVTPTNYQITFMTGEQVFKKSIGGERVRHHVMTLSGLMKGWNPSACDSKDSFATEPLGFRSWTLVAQPILGVIDPKRPEVLNGSQEFPDPEDPSQKMTINWDLHHCGK